MKPELNWLNNPIAPLYLVLIGFEHVKSRMGTLFDPGELTSPYATKCLQVAWTSEYVMTAHEAFYFAPSCLLVFRDDKDRWHLMIKSDTKELRWSGLIEMKEIVQIMVKHTS